MPSMWIWIIDSICFSNEEIRRQNRNNKGQVIFCQLCFTIAYRFRTHSFIKHSSPKEQKKQCVPILFYILCILPSFSLSMCHFIFSLPTCYFYIKKIIIASWNPMTLQDEKSGGAEGMTVVVCRPQGWHRKHLIASDFPARTIEYLEWIPVGRFLGNHHVRKTGN